MMHQFSVIWHLIKMCIVYCIVLCTAKNHLKKVQGPTEI